MSSNHLPTLYQEYIHLSRYSRWKNDKNRRETWPETVERYFDFFEEHLKENNNFVLDKETRNELENAVLNLEVMPSMRCLMTAGEALKRDNIAGYNCAYISIDNTRAFDEVLYVLMCGTGVGFSVESKYVESLPVIAEDFHETDTTIVVADSKVGWAKALRELIHLLYSGQIPKWDISKVRPAGAVLKTFGGRASGPGPLVDLFNFCVAVFKKAAGRRLTTIECHDIVCKIAEIVVVGGVRRSALISLSDLSDDRMRLAKSGEWWKDNVQRALANNSYVAREKPDVGIFMKEWLSLYESRSGERGIFSRYASKKKVDENGRRDPNHDWGTNPCCFTGVMKLLTTEGYQTFESLEGKDFHIVNANGNVTKGKVWKVGEKRPVARISFYNKDVPVIEATYDHIFKLSDGGEAQVKDLPGKKPMRYVNMRKEPNQHYQEEFHAGFILGDGVLTDLLNEEKRGLTICIGEKDHDVLRYIGGHNANSTDADGKLYLYTRHNAYVAEKYMLPARTLGNRGLPESIRTRNGLMGLFSANGCVINKSRVALKTTDYEQAIELVYTLSEMFNIQAYITTNKARETEFSNGVYTSKESYDVNIGRYLDIIKFAEEIGFVQKYKQEALQNLINFRAPIVKSIEGIGEMDIYDFNEPETNWGIVNGCVVHNSEIILRPREFCNLTEIVIRSTDTPEDLHKKIRLATILGTFQSTLTNFKYISKKWAENCNEERLLGVSMTGILDNKHTNGQDGEYFKFELEKLLRELKQTAVDVNKEWAERIGIPQSAAITCVKPSGCFTKDQKIKTNIGNISLDEIFSLNGINLSTKENEKRTWYDVTTNLKVYDENNKEQKITKLFINGVEETIKLTLENGEVIECTPNHKFKLKNNTWKKAEDLTEDDEIMAW